LDSNTPPPPSGLDFSLRPGLERKGVRSFAPDPPSVPSALRKYLLEHRLARGRRGGLFFGRPDGRPFSNQSLRQRAARIWRAAGLDPIGLHECRHTFASLMIAAGVNAKALHLLGHASVTITLDRYGDLFSGSAQEAAGLLDTYLERFVGEGPRRGALHVRCTALHKGPFPGVERGRLGSPINPKRSTNPLQIGHFSGGGGFRTLGGP
jgi:Phage integrase family